MAFFILCIAAIGPSYAQSEYISARMASSYVIEFPANWVVQEQDGIGYFFETDDSIIRVRPYDLLSQQGFIGDTAGDPEALIEWLVTDVFETREFSKSNILSRDFGDIEGLSYTYVERADGESYGRIFLLKPLDSGTIIVGYMRSREGTSLNDTDVENLTHVVTSVQLTSTIEFYEGTNLEIPEGWNVNYDYNKDFSEVRLLGEHLTVDILLWPGWGGISGLEDSDEFFAHIYIETFGSIEPLNRSDFQSIRIAGYEAIHDPVRNDRRNADGLFHRGFFALTLPNNSALTIEVLSEDANDSLEPIYEFLDTLQPGRTYVCPLWPDPGTRIREEASTSSPIVRATTEDDFILVAYEALRDANGYLWYRVDGGFIRSDVVWHEQSSCASIRGY